MKSATKSATTCATKSATTCATLSCVTVGANFIVEKFRTPAGFFGLIGVFVISLLMMTPTIARAGSAETEVFAIVIGNNEPPVDVDSSLQLLRYADDDAMRYYSFLQTLAPQPHIHLLSFADTLTQKKYPNAVPLANDPSLANLFRAVGDLEKKVDRARQKGKNTALYFIFSGHGAINSQAESFLAMQDGELNHQILFDKVLTRVSADYTHVIIDACYAAGVVGTRGMFDRETDSRSSTVSEAEKRDFESWSHLKNFRGLGLLVASSAFEESHEWSRYESGVFSHEVLSGLSGPADVNNDGKIEYSELSAFVVSANRAVKDPRGQISLIAKAPLKNQREPLIDYSHRNDVSFLYGDLSSLGHFYIEVAYGIRYMDANPGYQEMTYIAVPSQKTFFVRTANQEAMANVPAGESLCISDLRFKRRQVSQRGTLESALRNGLFQTKFGVAYYQGYVDKLNQIGVEMDAPKMMFDQAETIVGPSRRDFAPVMEHSGLAPPNTAFSPKDDDAPFRRRRVAAVTLGAISATGYAAAIVLGALTLKTRNDYRDTTFERESSQLNTRYQHLGTGFWISSAAATVALVGAILIRPRKKNALPPTGGAHATGVNLRLHLDF